MNQKIVTIFFWIGIVSLLIAPWALWYIESGIFFPYITSKGFFWRFFIQIAFVSWAACALLSPKYWINWRHPFFLALSSFMAVILLANTFGHNPYISFWSSAERMDGYISLLYLAGWFIPLIGLLKTKKNLYYFVLFSLGIATILAFVGLQQDTIRVSSRLGNPIYLGALSFFGVFLSGYFMMSKEKFLPIPRVLQISIFGILSLVFLYTIFRTGTRGALLGLITGGITSAVLIALYARKMEDAWWKRLSILFIGAVVLIGGGIFINKDQLAKTTVFQEHRLLQKLVTTSSDEKNTRTRLANWNMAIEGWKEKPILGWGQENYTEVFAKHYDVDKLYDAEDWYDRVHNNFLDWLVFGGLIGLIAYCALFMIPLYLIWKRSSFDVLEKSVLTGLFIGYLFQNVVAFYSLASGIFLYLSFAYVFVGTNEEYEVVDAPKVEGEKTFSYLVILGLIIASGFWIYHSIYLPRESARNYIQYLITTGPEASPEKSEAALPLFEKIFEHQTFMERELIVNAMKQKSRIFVPGTNTLTAQKYFSLISAKTSDMMILHNHPTSIYSFYGSFLLELGLYEQSLPILQIAREKSPKKIKLIFREARALEELGRIEEARGLYKEGYELAPEWAIGEKVWKDFLVKQVGK